MDYGISTSFWHELPNREQLRQAREAGFAFLEYANHVYQPEEFLLAGDRLQKDAALEGLRFWSVHIPYRPFWDFSIPDETWRSRAVDGCKRVLDACVSWQAPVLVLHLCVGPANSAADYVQRKELAKASALELGTYARQKGITLCCEVLIRNYLTENSYELMDVTDGVQSFINLDVNHVLFESHDNFIDVAGDRIRTIHLSDYDVTDEKHWFPGDGVIDWRNVKKRLDSIGYQGVYLFEVRNDLRRLEDILPLFQQELERKKKKICFFEPTNNGLSVLSETVLNFTGRFRNCSAFSRGLAEGLPLNPETLQALLALGFEDNCLSRRTSRVLTKEDLSYADSIYVFSLEDKGVLLGRFPQAAPKVTVLSRVPMQELPGILQGLLD